MITYKNRLPVVVSVGYISAAPHKSGAGFRSLSNKIAHSRASGFFTCKASSRLFRIMAGRAGEPKGSPVSILSGTANPVRLATSSFAASGGEFTYIKIGTSSWPTANNAANLRIDSISKPKSTAASTAPAHWQHTYRFVLIICRQICRCTGSLRSWTILQTICWSCSSLLTPRNEQTKKPLHLKYCLRSTCWWGAYDHVIQGAG